MAMPSEAKRTRPTWSALGMLRSAVGVCGLLFLSILPGCANQQQELVESELRKKEMEIDELKLKQGSKEAEIQQLEIELEMLQRCRARDAKQNAGGIGAVQIVEKITLGRATGGVNENPQIDGDDSLQVLLEPRDA